MSTTHDMREPAASEHPLSDREREILRLVVKSFIDEAGPIGSRTLAKRHPSIGLSPASIRNTMRDLEEMGYLDHPYTSAGRMPTERGYRTFVDELMERPELSETEKQLLKLQLEQLMGDTEELFRESSRLLGRLTNLLGIVLSPRLSTGVLERLDAVPLSSSRLMFVVSVRGGLVKTIVVEFDTHNAERRDLDHILRILNERLAGLTLEEIRRTYEERIRDVGDDTGIVRLILDESAVLFSEPTEGRLRYGGARNILSQPEFQEPTDLRHLIEMIEDENFVVNLLEERPDAERGSLGRALVSIGSENSTEKADRFSIVTSNYKLGDAIGTLGVIGPTRMDYGRVVALVENTATLLSRSMGEQK